MRGRIVVGVISFIFGITVGMQIAKIYIKMDELEQPKEEMMILQPSSMYINPITGDILIAHTPKDRDLAIINGLVPFTNESLWKWKNTNQGGRE